MKCNLEFFAQEKMGFVSIDAAGANQLIGVIAFIYFKTKKMHIKQNIHPGHKLCVDKPVNSISTTLYQYLNTKLE